MAAALIGAPVASGHRQPHSLRGTAPAAIADGYSTSNVGTLAVTPRDGVLANDGGGNLQLISHTDPAHGSLRLKPNGAFHYVPAAGFTGGDTFTYTVADAVHLWSTHLPPLRAFGGVNLTGGAFGSSLYPVPGRAGEFYGLEDRGPNVGPASGAFDVEPIPSYDPAIAEFRFAADGRAVLVRKIRLRDVTGHPYSGLVNSLNSTGETIEDLSGRVLATDPDGYDPEGLVAMRDGKTPMTVHTKRDAHHAPRSAD